MLQLVHAPPIAILHGQNLFFGSRLVALVFFLFVVFVVFIGNRSQVCLLDAGTPRPSFFNTFGFVGQSSLRTGMLFD